MWHHDCVPVIETVEVWAEHWYHSSILRSLQHILWLPMMISFTVWLPIIMASRCQKWKKNCTPLLICLLFHKQHLLSETEFAFSFILSTFFPALVWTDKSHAKTKFVTNIQVALTRSRLCVKAHLCVYWYTN